MQNDENRFEPPNIATPNVNFEYAEETKSNRRKHNTYNGRRCLRRYRLRSKDTVSTQKRAPTTLQ